MTVQETICDLTKYNSHDTVMVKIEGTLYKLVGSASTTYNTTNAVTLYLDPIDEPQEQPNA